MRSIIVALLSVFAVSVPIARAQTTEDHVRKVVRQALDGLASRDTVMLRNVFAPSAQLVLVSYDGDSTILRSIPTRSIAASLNAPGPRRREELRNERISVASDLATLTADYLFYFDDALHHCGTAMYDLVRVKNEWRIVQIRETDHRVGCTP
ncbi:MAG: nuclear transport factor 2 family protein [Gemmatimonadetes bacterium]|nr:nuclear transport factor 2 family protein [Gemmatimonadota bacterium]